MSLVMCRCGGIVEADVCSKCGPKKRVLPSWSNYGATWDSFSVRYRKENPLCVRCLENGKVRASDEVHHIVPVTEAPELKFELSNLKALCVSCHRQEDADRRRNG